jgi:hypothetical protein
LVRDDIVLVGGGTTLTYRCDSSADFPALTPAWSDYEIPLDTAAGWRIDTSGSYGSRIPATSTQIAAVLRGLTALRIRAEFLNENDTGGLDNPQFAAP